MILVLRDAARIIAPLCHGCHGDKDNELFVGGRHQAVMRTSVVP